jgi:hypothetical protein
MRWWVSGSWSLFSAAVEVPDKGEKVMGKKVAEMRKAVAELELLLRQLAVRS